jgi:hypothetical protein
MNPANDLKETRDKIFIAMENSFASVGLRDLRSGSVAGAIRVGTVHGWEERSAPAKMLGLVPRRGGV